MIGDLVSACARKNVREVEDLLKAGCDPNLEFKGQRPLHVAAKVNSTALVKLLLDSHASVNARDATGATPFMLTSDQQVKEVLEHAGAITSLDYLQTMPASRGMESTSKMKALLLRKGVITACVPFVFLLFVNGIWFAVEFVGVSFCFYFLALGYFVSEITIKPPWYRHGAGSRTLPFDGLPEYWLFVNDPKHDFGLEYEDVEFKSDGLTLRGWFVAGKSPRGVGLVCVHGAGRDRRAWLRQLPFLVDAGYSCLLFDLREHGCSDGVGKGTTFGMKERYDVLAASTFMRSRGFKRIAVIGTSMGASSAIMAAALDPKLIDLVIAENPLLSCAHLQDQHIINLLGPYTTHSKIGQLAFKAFRFCCSNWLNLKVGNKPSRKCQALHVVSSLSPRPILIMHGTADTVVPPRHSEILFELAKEPKQFWMCPKAHHCGLWNVDQKAYESHVLSFLSMHLS